MPTFANRGHKYLAIILKLSHQQSQPALNTQESMTNDDFYFLETEG